MCAGCHFCGSQDILVPGIGIAFGMNGNDYSFCKKCLTEMTGAEFFEKLFLSKGYAFPPTLIKIQKIV